MSVVGALIEIPTMLSLIKMADFFRGRWYEGEETTRPSKLGEKKKGGKGVEEGKEEGEKGGVEMQV